MSTFGRDLLLSLPPMDQRDWKVKQADLEKLGLLDASAVSDLHQKICMNGSGGDSDSGSSALRNSIRGSLKEYMDRLKDKPSVNARFSVTEEDGKTVLRTYAETVDASNLSSGCWMAHWTLDSESDTAAELSGTVSMHVYYFEDNSNVQLRASKPYQTSFTAEDGPDGLATKIVNQIGHWEREVYDELSSQFNDQEIESKLRKVRRILPITKTRFKWDSAAQANVKLLNARK